MGDRLSHGDVAEDGMPATEPPSLADRLFALEMRVGYIEHVLEGALQLLQRAHTQTAPSPAERGCQTGVKR